MCVCAGWVYVCIYVCMYVSVVSVCKNVTLCVVMFIVVVTVFSLFIFHHKVQLTLYGLFICVSFYIFHLFVPSVLSDTIFSNQNSCYFQRCL